MAAGSLLLSRLSRLRNAHRQRRRTSPASHRGSGTGYIQPVNESVTHAPGLHCQACAQFNVCPFGAIEPKPANYEIALRDSVYVSVYSSSNQRSYRLETWAGGPRRTSNRLIWDPTPTIAQQFHTAWRRVRFRRSSLLS